MVEDSIEDLYNTFYALLQMNKIPNSRGKFVHMLGVCDLAQQTLDELKNELNSILTGTNSRD